MSEEILGNLRAINSINRRMRIMENCHEAQRAVLRDPAFADKRQEEVRRLKEVSEGRLKALKGEALIREELAKAQAKSGIVLEAIKKKLADHLKGYPLYYGSLQKISDPCFKCGAGLKKLRNPSFGVTKDIQGKKKRRMERLALIREARATAAKMQDGNEKRSLLKDADDFARNIDGAEKAILSRDVYHYTDEKINAEGAPVGYSRGSENSEILKKYGIPRELLEPNKSKFRAELYIPDPEVFGAGAKPVLVFKGTDLNCLEDYNADLSQASGNGSDYYKKAIKLGNFLNKKTYGKFEVAGHSLGGGMASAVGTVTGCQTTVFNPAGLHPNTVASYNKNVMGDTLNVSAFVIKGEVLNSSQDAINSLGHRLMLASANSQMPLLSVARLAPLLVGAQFSSIPSQVGSRTNLSAQIGFKTPNPIKRHSIDTVISSIEQEKKENMKLLRQLLLPDRRVTYDLEYLG